MARFAFCSGTYQSISPNINAELAMNLYPEQAASPNARSAIALLGTDGLSLFASLPQGSGESVPGIFTCLNRTFVVGVIVQSQQMHLYEVMANGTLIDRSPAGLGAPISTAPVSWAFNPLQLAFTVAGTGAIYIFTLATNAITTITSYADTGQAFAAVQIGYLDGFFVTFLAGTNTIQVSNLEDGTNWQSINVGVVSEFADAIVSMKIQQRTVLFCGQKKSVLYYNSGALFPLAPLPGALIEEGSGAAFGIEEIDNTWVWIGGNADEGNGIAWRLNGYTPERISTHDVETAWQLYATVADAISSKYQTRGHKFWQIYFPTANATWRYDIATGLWHQVGKWNSGKGAFDAHQTSTFTFNFGLHLAGDPSSGNIYVISPNNLTDNGTNIRRVRRGPYVAKEHEEEFHRRLEILLETGLPSAIIAPSELPVSLFLADSSGQVWNVQVNDAGVIVPTRAPAGTLASVPIVADSVNQSTFWQLVISIGGAVSGVPSNFGRSDVAIVGLATNQTFLDSGITCNQQGVVASVQPQPHLREPLVQMRYSDDGVHTWSNTRTEGMGLTGDFRKRVLFRRLGKSRNRVYEIVIDDPIPVRIVDAFINGPEQTTERLNAQLAKMA